MLTLGNACVAAAAMAAIILACRALPFLFFSGRKPPKALSFIEASTPPIAMTVLAVSSFTSIHWELPPHGIPALVAGTVVVLLHLWKRNTLLSILGGTLLYMGLSAALSGIFPA
jgi:branched-subunit amino acid transport protein AzlD